MKTKMKVAVCTLLCMTMACAAANAEGGTTNSTNSGRPQTQQSQMKNRKKKGMQQKPDDDSADQPELPEIGGGLDEAPLKSLLDAGVITQEQYDTLLERLTVSSDRKKKFDTLRGLDESQKPLFK